MRTNVTFSEISNELYNIFSDDRQAAAYMADSFGPQYIGLCGWAGAMSPANRAAFVQTFGRDVTDRAEAEARARVDEYRAAVAASAYHRHELEADTFAASYGDREKSQIRKASAKLAAARRRNLVAMASALFPGVKFSAKKWDGWGGSYELTWTDGPTEEHLKEAADFDLFESGRDTFDGMTDCAGVQYSEFGDFAEKYFGLFGQIRMDRHESEEFRQTIADRIRAAVPGLPEGDQEPIKRDGGQLSAICGMFPDVCASYIVQNLERYGLRDAVAYITRCIDATPTQEDETPSDSPKWESCDADGAAYGETEKSLSEVLEAHQRMKEKHPRGVILYEVGDYYAAAFADADDVAKAVEVVNVENDPLGFPFVKFRTFWLSDVLPSILAAGLKVNIVGESRNAASIADAIKGAA